MCQSRQTPNLKTPSRTITWAWIVGVLDEVFDPFNENEDDIFMPDDDDGEKNHMHTIQTFN